MKFETEYRTSPRYIYTKTTIRCPRCSHKNLLVKKIIVLDMLNILLSVHIATAQKRITHPLGNKTLMSQTD